MSTPNDETLMFFKRQKEGLIVERTKLDAKIELMDKMIEDRKREIIEEAATKSATAVMGGKKPSVGPLKSIVGTDNRINEMSLKDACLEIVAEFPNLRTQEIIEVLKQKGRNSASLEGSTYSALYNLKQEKRIDAFERKWKLKSRREDASNE